MSVRPLDSVAHAHVAADDSQDLSLPRRRAKLWGIDDDKVAPAGSHRSLLRAWLPGARPLRRGLLRRGLLRRGLLGRGPLRRGPLRRGPLRRGPLRRGLLAVAFVAFAFFAVAVVAFAFLAVAFLALGFLVAVFFAGMVRLPAVPITLFPSLTHYLTGLVTRPSKSRLNGGRHANRMTSTASWLFAHDTVFESPRGPQRWGTRFEGKEAVREGLAAFRGIPDVH